MEIEIRTNVSSKKINVENSITSLESNDESVVKHLINDYKPIVIDNTNLFFLGKTVLDEISSYATYPELTICYDVLKILELYNTFMDKEIDKLSTTEKIYLNILRNISKTNEIIVFTNIFLGLDYKNQKKIIKLINYLKDKMIVIILSDDVNYLYKYSDNSIIVSKRIIKFGKCDDIYEDVKTLIKLKLDIPDLCYITYKAKEEKNVKLFYSKDVRDIIKDIYKHV
mgnify:CR=1 FL=1